MNATLKRIVKPAYQYLKCEVSKRKVGSFLKEKVKIYLEVGAGDKKGENGWVTIDMTPNCDLYWDLRRGIPFPDATVAKIYSSHFMEHLSYQESQIFLDECLRVLVPGGAFLVCVPNARLYIEAYNHPEVDNTHLFSYPPALNNTTRMDYLNYVGYMVGHHKYMFDEENLLHILTAKGFKNARPRAFDPALDLAERDFESLYAEAVK